MTPAEWEMLARFLAETQRDIRDETLRRFGLCASLGPYGRQEPHTCQLYIDWTVKCRRCHGMEPIPPEDTRRRHAVPWDDAAEGGEQHEHPEEEEEEEADELEQGDAGEPKQDAAGEPEQEACDAEVCDAVFGHEQEDAGEPESEVWDAIEFEQEDAEEEVAEEPSEVEEEHSGDEGRALEHKIITVCCGFVGCRGGGFNRWTGGS